MITQSFSYAFEIQNAYTAVLHHKQYFALLVTSTDLVTLRQKYDLAEQPTFKDHLIRLHITIGVM
ncbi:MAG: hypothetical protein P4M14_10725 [Gammaproteobacteria bacterium]|nr:hypothetical protein [Gammaproteobacteria bacterium]